VTPPNTPPKADIPLIHLLPNMLTIAAICAGLSAIRFGVYGDFERAVILILAACVLDGLDGRLARLLKCSSPVGAELDSLADFLNFGVAPPVVIYFWALQDMRSFGWLTAMIFAVCCALRLARFNVAAKSDRTDDDGSYFVGVPAPAGALLAMVPMYVSFGFFNSPLLPDALIALFLLFTGFLLVSTIPTWSFKSTKISRGNVIYVLVAFAIVGTAVLTYPWITLLGMCIAYAAVVLWSLFNKKKPPRIPKT
jgi:CDP-diacylglycerol--serine O-phosphatidyltransferase